MKTLARAAEDDQDAALFRIAAFTDLRLGELRALRWSDADFGLRLVHVRRNYTRGVEGSPMSGRDRSVPLIDQAATALDALSRRERFADEDDLAFVDEVGATWTTGGTGFAAVLSTVTDCASPFLARSGRAYRRA
jgi:integrase